MVKRYFILFSIFLIFLSSISNSLANQVEDIKKGYMRFDNFKSIGTVFDNYSNDYLIDKKWKSYENKGNNIVMFSGIIPKDGVIRGCVERELSILNKIDKFEYIALFKINNQNKNYFDEVQSWVKFKYDGQDYYYPDRSMSMLKAIYDNKEIAVHRSINFLDIDKFAQKLRQKGGKPPKPMWME
jgi:hypothetical protein